MTNEERQLLLSLAETVIELKRSRDDMAIGLAAAIFDLHRLLIQAGHQTQHDALSRLTAQTEALASTSPNQAGVKFLDALIATLASDKLNAASWLREPLAGRG
jgi:hypothetical protein